MTKEEIYWRQAFPVPQPECWYQLDYTYTGRNDIGRPTWAYEHKRVCYER